MQSVPCNYIVHISFDNVFFKGISASIFLYFLTQSVCISAQTSFYLHFC